MKKLDEYGMCCPEPEESCVQDTTCNDWKDKYKIYLEQEKCKIEKPFIFDICNHDPNNVYFMQYRNLNGKYNPNYMEDEELDKLVTEGNIDDDAR